MDPDPRSDPCKFDGGLRVRWSPPRPARAGVPSIGWLRSHAGLPRDADGAGHAVAYAVYRHNNELRQDARDYSACALSDAGTSCGGSANAIIPNFIVGNADYANALPLANPVNDARLVAETLEGLGFDVTLATDLTPPPTVRGMKTSSAMRSTVCTVVSRPSWLAVISRKVTSSAPC